MERKLISQTLRKKNKLPREVRQLIENSSGLEQYQEWLNTRSSHINKLHFIIGHGILREELRDEIFCQICKQLSNNPNTISFKKGWILLSLCIGCFPPSQNFELYLRQFIRKGPELYAPYCETRLDRKIQNGVRKQPPSWMELKACKTTEPITVTVYMMNEASVQLEIDSASTSEEVCIAVAKAINLTDLLGFSLFITIMNKVMTLGCEHQFIFDAISSCEQFAKEQGIAEKSVKWQLYIQKEMFLPWHNPSDDAVATDLIYHQLVKGVNYGDYICTSEKDIAMIAALCYYAKFGAKYEKDLMLKKLPEYLPKTVYRQETAAQWETLVSSAFAKCRCFREKLPKIAAKEDVVYFAKITWILKFSRFFEVLRINDGTTDPSQGVYILAINWSGVYLIDSQEQVVVRISKLISIHEVVIFLILSVGNFVHRNHEHYTKIKSRFRYRRFVHSHNCHEGNFEIQIGRRSHNLQVAQLHADAVEETINVCGCDSKFLKNIDGRIVFRTKERRLDNA
jgi:myosin-7